MSEQTAPDQSAGKRSVEPIVQSQVFTPLTNTEFFFAAVALLLWFLMFSGGALISTQEYRSELGKSVVWYAKIKPLIVCLLFWTTSNLGLLSCLSAFLGAIGYRTLFTIPLSPHCSVSTISDSTRRMLLTSSLSAVMRGFGVYTLSLSGLLLLATDTLVKPDQETYLKLAPTISIISFYAGFNPQVFGIMLERVNKYMRAEPNPPASKMTAATNTSQLPAPSPAPPSV